MLVAVEIAYRMFNGGPVGTDKVTKAKSDQVTVNNDIGKQRQR